MMTSRAVLFAVLSSAAVALALGADSLAPGGPDSKPTYSYATNGVQDNGVNRFGDHWKLLLDQSNLGGNELEVAELEMHAGSSVRSHTHAAVEILYVLSGVYGHEVNGKLYLLKPGMIGIVRPGDHVRHLVPKSGPAKVLIFWVPPGEAAKAFLPGKGVTPEPVPEAQSLEP